MAFNIYNLVFRNYEWNDLKLTVPVLTLNRLE